MKVNNVKKGIILLLLIVFSIFPNGYIRADTTDNITLSKTNVEMTLNHVLELKIRSNQGYEEEEFIWKSSNEKVVIVNEIGGVVSLKPGNAVITATKDNIKLSCKIKVKNYVTLEDSIDQLCLGLWHFDFKEMNQYIQSWGKYTTKGLLSFPSLKKHFKKCAYEVVWHPKVVKVKGNIATVKIKFYYKDSKDFYKKFDNEIMKSVYNGEVKNAEKVVEKQPKLVNRWYATASKKAKDNTITKTTTLSFVKTKYCWKLKKVNEDFYNVVFANLPRTIKKLNKY